MSEQTPSPTALNPTALPVEAAAALLSRAGGAVSGGGGGGGGVTTEMIRFDIEAGAPTNADGTINLVHYAAWLVRAMATGGTGGAGGD